MLEVGVAGEGEIVVGHGEEAEAEGEGEDSDCCSVYVERPQLSILCLERTFLSIICRFPIKMAISMAVVYHLLVRPYSLYRTSSLWAKPFRLYCLNAPHSSIMNIYILPKTANQTIYLSRFRHRWRYITYCCTPENNSEIWRSTCSVV
jgi:hypothetical protein